MSYDALKCPKMPEDPPWHPPNLPTSPISPLPFSALPPRHGRLPRPSEALAALPRSAGLPPTSVPLSHALPAPSGHLPVIVAQFSRPFLHLVACIAPASPSSQAAHQAHDSTLSRTRTDHCRDTVGSPDPPNAAAQRATVLEGRGCWVRKVLPRPIRRYLTRYTYCPATTLYGE